MSRYFLIAASGILSCLLAGNRFVTAFPKTEKEPIRISELNERPVLGELSIPLGTCCDIQAKIIAGRELGSKRDAGAYLLSVTHVEGKQLDKPLNFHFSEGPGSKVDLASDGFELYELKNGKKAETLTDAQIRELEQGYVGKTVKLIAYETGMFSGIPRNLPKGTQPWPDSAYHFSSTLVIMDERK